MNEKNLLKVIEILTNEISRLETAVFVAEYDKKELEKENARLAELLTPTAKGELVNE